MCSERVKGTIAIITPSSQKENVPVWTKYLKSLNQFIVENTED